MIEAKSHLIRLSAGRIRVLRLACADGRCHPLAYDVEKDVEMCQICGCTEFRGCVPPCGWANRSHTLCTACAEKETRG